jgi:phage gpG-like protein
MPRIIDHTAELLKLINNKTTAALEVAGSMVESTAIEQALVDTGKYRGSLTHETVGFCVVIGSNVEYAPWIEIRYKPVLRMSLLGNLGNIRRLFSERSV